MAVVIFQEIHLAAGFGDQNLAGEDQAFAVDVHPDLAQGEVARAEMRVLDHSAGPAGMKEEGYRDIPGGAGGYQVAGKTDAVAGYGNRTQAVEGLLVNDFAVLAQNQAVAAFPDKGAGA